MLHASGASVWHILENCYIRHVTSVDVAEMKKADATRCGTCLKRIVPNGWNPYRS